MPQNPLGVLATLEHQCQIERGPLDQALQAAVGEQRELDEWLTAFAGQVARWKKEARRLEQRRDHLEQCFQKMKEELLDAPFHQEEAVHLLARLKYLRDQVSNKLQSRSMLASVLRQTIEVGGKRGPGKPGAGLINRCLRDLVDQLTGPNDREKRWTPKFGQLAKVGSRPRRRSLEYHRRDGVTLPS